jgi:putative inorganic carbon (hco3(-)) transporter
MSTYVPELRSPKGWLRSLVVLGAIVLAPLAGLLAQLQPLLTISLVFGVAYMVAAYRNLTVGLALFTGLTFFATAASKLGGGLTVTKAAGVLLAGLWLLVIATRGTRVPLLFRDFTGFAALVLAFMAWDLTSVLWAHDQSTALQSSVRLLQGLILIFVIYTAVNQLRHVQWLTTAFVVGALFASLAALANGGSAGNGGRAGGGFDDPNEFAGVVVPAMLFACFAFAASRRSARWLYLLALPVYAIAFRGADSQGGIMALVAGSLVACVFGGPIRNWARGLTLVLFAYGTMQYMLIGSTQSLTEGGHSRENLWHAAITVWKSHPLKGVGAGNFQVVEPAVAFSNTTFDRVDLIVKPEVAHNTYLHMLAETGLMGLGLMLLVAFSALVIGLRAARAFDRLGERQLSILARGAVAATVAILVDYTFQSAQYEKQLWLLVGFCVSMHGVARVISERARSARPTG